MNTPVTEYPLKARVWRRTSTVSPEWVIELTGVINDTDLIVRHTAPGNIPPEDAVGLRHLYEVQDALLGLADAVDATFADADTHEAFQAFNREHGRVLKNAQIIENDRPGDYEPIPVRVLPDKIGPTPLASVLDSAQGMLDEMGLHDSQVVARQLRDLMAALDMRPQNSLFRPRDDK